jgi:uncharacterized membrane protein YhaH (DUF805 family)
MTANPYAPPGAKVADVASVSDEVQEIRLWSAKGRVGRLRYLAYTFASGLIMTGLAVAAVVILGPTAGGIVYAVLYIPFLVLAVFTGIKRSHDMNWSGWTLLIPLVPGFGLGGISATFDPNNSSRVIVMLSALILSLSGLIWMFKKGTEGSNDYGAPPPPNTTGVKILACTVPVIFVIGILAAIALPAYQQYVKRVQEAQQGR